MRVAHRVPTAPNLCLEHFKQIKPCLLRKRVLGHKLKASWGIILAKMELPGVVKGGQRTRRTPFESSPLVTSQSQSLYCVDWTGAVQKILSDVGALVGAAVGAGVSWQMLGVPGAAPSAGGTHCRPLEQSP